MILSRTGLLDKVQAAQWGARYQQWCCVTFLSKLAGVEGMHAVDRFEHHVHDHNRGIENIFSLMNTDVSWKIE